MRESCALVSQVAVSPAWVASVVSSEHPTSRLSNNNCMVVSSHPFDEMSVVQLSVSVTDDDGGVEDFACEAAVVRCALRPDGRHDLGLYFTAVTDEARAVLQRVLKSGSILTA